MNSVYLNGFSLEILMEDEPIEKILYNNSNYFGLPNKSEYKLNRMCPAHLTTFDNVLHCFKYVIFFIK